MALLQNPQHLKQSGHTHIESQLILSVPTVPNPGYTAKHTPSQQEINDIPMTVPIFLSPCLDVHPMNRIRGL